MLGYFETQGRWRRRIIEKWSDKQDMNLYRWKQQKFSGLLLNWLHCRNGGTQISLCLWAVLLGRIRFQHRNLRLARERRTWSAVHRRLLARISMNTWSRQRNTHLCRTRPLQIKRRSNHWDLLNVKVRFIVTCYFGKNWSDLRLSDGIKFLRNAGPSKHWTACFPMVYCHKSKQRSATKCLLFYGYIKNSVIKKTCWVSNNTVFATTIPHPWLLQTYTKTFFITSVTNLYHVRFS